ncbi:MAG: DUF4492 domain-containing protein [Bacteroidales bacterium]|nr:DUF4492 domain-containing protein [Bacteroidales bacterium]
MNVKSKIKSVWLFYVEGFKNMTWGKQLWFLIFLKVIVLFLVLRLFFFEPVLSGKDEAEKIEYVGSELINHIDN